MQNRNFNNLYAFTQVVKLGNFSSAAQALGVQPSALSYRMNDLENRLNTKLLNRTTRSMSPTEAGQRLYERIALMFGGIQEALAALGDLRGKVSGRLRINAAENLAYYLIYPKVRSFLAAFPEVDVEILISNSWSDIVAQGFDFGVRPLSDVAQDMVAVPISGERAMCVVAAPDYLTRQPHLQQHRPDQNRRPRRLGSDMAAALRRRRRTRLGRTAGNFRSRPRHLSADGLVLPAQPPQNAGSGGVD